MNRFRANLHPALFTLGEVWGAAKEKASDLKEMLKDYEPQIVGGYQFVPRLREKEKDPLKETVRRFDTAVDKLLNREMSLQGKRLKVITSHTDDNQYFSLEVMDGPNLGYPSTILILNHHKTAFTMLKRNKSGEDPNRPKTNVTIGKINNILDFVLRPTNIDRQMRPEVYKNPNWWKENYPEDHMQAYTPPSNDVKLGGYREGNPDDLLKKAEPERG